MIQIDDPRAARGTHHAAVDAVDDLLEAGDRACGQERD
jgi:hypothetical protein